MTIVVAKKTAPCSEWSGALVYYYMMCGLLLHNGGAIDYVDAARQCVEWC